VLALPYDSVTAYTDGTYTPPPPNHSHIFQPPSPGHGVSHAAAVITSPHPDWLSA
jgi:hypothetical protein